MTYQKVFCSLHVPVTMLGDAKNTSSWSWYLWMNRQSLLTDLLGYLYNTDLSMDIQSSTPLESKGGTQGLLFSGERSSVLFT